MGRAVYSFFFDSSRGGRANIDISELFLPRRTGAAVSVGVRGGRPPPHPLPLGEGHLSQGGEGLFVGGCTRTLLSPAVPSPPSSPTPTPPTPTPSVSRQTLLLLSVTALPSLCMQPLCTTWRVTSPTCPPPCAAARRTALRWGRGRWGRQGGNGEYTCMYIHNPHTQRPACSLPLRAAVGSSCAGSCRVLTPRLIPLRQPHASPLPLAPPLPPRLPQVGEKMLGGTDAAVLERLGKILGYMTLAGESPLEARALDPGGSGGQILGYMALGCPDMAGPLGQPLGLPWQTLWETLWDA